MQGARVGKEGGGGSKDGVIIATCDRGGVKERQGSSSMAVYDPGRRKTTKIIKK